MSGRTKELTFKIVCSDVLLLVIYSKCSIYIGIEDGR